MNKLRTLTTGLNAIPETGLSAQFIMKIQTICGFILFRVALFCDNALCFALKSNEILNSRRKKKSDMKSYCAEIHDSKMHQIELWIID